MWGTESGSEVMKRIAAPMVGGLVSSAILTLVIIPVVYDIWKRLALRQAAPADSQPVATEVSNTVE
jgi:Cu(I)/Ag(I) efflux system membrane protein CusA/SilA